MGEKKKWKKKLLTNWRSIPAMILAGDVAPRFASRESFVRDVRFASASISIRSMILLAAAQCMLPRGTRNARAHRACVCAQRRLVHGYLPTSVFHRGSTKDERQLMVDSTFYGGAIYGQLSHAEQRCQNV